MEALQKRIRSIQVRQKQHKEADRMQKMEAWGKIKSDSPELAEFLIEVNRVFGKPEQVNVWIDSRKII